MTQVQLIDEKYIQVIIERAGRTIMMLPSSGTLPAGYRSCLPEYIHDFADLIEAPKQNTPVRLRPTMRQMDELDMVEDWLVDLSKHCRRCDKTEIARMVAAAMLHYPFLEGRRVYSFRRLGEMFNRNNKTVKSWYMQGLCIIADQVNLQLTAEESKPAFLMG